MLHATQCKPFLAYGDTTLSPSAPPLRPFWLGADGETLRFSTHTGVTVGRVHTHADVQDRCQLDWLFRAWPPDHLRLTRDSRTVPTVGHAIDTYWMMPAMSASTERHDTRRVRSYAIHPTRDAEHRGPLGYVIIADDGVAAWQLPNASDYATPRLHFMPCDDLPGADALRGMCRINLMRINAQVESSGRPLTRVRSSSWQ